MQPYRIIISGGGTGGHIFPAIAIAKTFRALYPDCAVLFVGAKGRMEMQKVPQEGFEIKGLWISGLQRSLSPKNLLFPIKVVYSVLRSFAIIYKFKPTLVIGTGGYASGPLLYAAALKKIPCFIQEQNSFPGITNKFLAKYATNIFVAYPNMERFFPLEKLVFTGNPLRNELAEACQDRAKALSFFSLNPNKKTVLVIGGSLGSKKINAFIAQRLAFFKDLDLQLIWQCGSIYANQYLALNHKPEVGVYSFIKEMGMAYAAADVIISRAGALSVSELASVGKPVVFVPSPNVAEDHQTKNAESVAQGGAAIVIPEAHLERDFEAIFTKLIHSESSRTGMGEALKKLHKPNATQEIVLKIVKSI